MEIELKSSLKGKDLWLPLFSLFLSIIIFYVFYFNAVFNDPLSAIRVALIFMLAFIMAIPFVQLYILKVMLTKISVNDKALAFTGEYGRFFLINLGGILLTCITLGFYGPWYSRKIIDYISSNTSLEGSPFNFKSTGGNLLKLTLLILVIPFIIFYTSLAAFVIATLDYNAGYTSPLGIFFAIYILASTLLAFALYAFYHFFYKWYVNFQWKDKSITLSTNFWPTIGIMLGQTILTIITFGIYWPARYIKLNRYFISKITIAENENNIGNFVFKGTCKNGFLYFWGQTLLTIITFGIYYPWAYTNIFNWTINNTSVSSSKDLFIAAATN